MKRGRSSRRLLIGAVAVCAGAAIAVTCALLLKSEPATASTRVVAPMASVVPAGKLMKVEVSNSGGALGSTYLVDPANRTCVYAVPGEGGDARPYAAIAVYDASGQSEINGVTLEIYSTSSHDYSEIEAKLDTLGGQVVQVSGDAQIAGVDVVVVEGKKVSPEIGQTVDIRGYLDPQTGVVVREEMTAGKDKLVLTRSIVSPGDEELGAVSRESLGEVVDDMKRERLQVASTADFPVLVLPKGALGLTFASLVPSGEPDYARVEYYQGSGPENLAVVIRIWNLDTSADKLRGRYVPLEQVENEPLEAGPAGSTRFSFQYRNAAVQIWAMAGKVSLPASEIAKMLVPIEESGLL